MPQTTANVMQFFAARTLKHDAVPAASATGPQAELKRMELFLERTAVIEGSAMAADIVGDSRAVLVSTTSFKTLSVMPKHANSKTNMIFYWNAALHSKQAQLWPRLLALAVATPRCLSIYAEMTLGSIRARGPDMAGSRASSNHPVGHGCHDDCTDRVFYAKVFMRDKPAYSGMHSEC